MRYKIRPVVYEDNDQRKIRAAFKAGCGGVIVPLDVPEAVSAEINALKTQADQHSNMIDTFHAALRGPNGKHSQIHWTKPQESLAQTQHWLVGVWERAVKDRFACPAKTSKSLMSLWFGSSLDRPWHIDVDTRREARLCDIHVHVSGPGLKVASPPRELKMELGIDSFGLFYIKQPPGKEMEPDKYLEKKGIEFIGLKPGQMIYFNQHCLHKSSGADSSVLKVRAGIF